jgi:hypothetical protein
MASNVALRRQQIMRETKSSECESFYMNEPLIVILQKPKLYKANCI